MALLTLFMGVGLKCPQILTLYMLGWKGLVLEVPRMYHTYVDVGLVQTGLDLIESYGWGGVGSGGVGGWTQ